MSFREKCAWITLVSVLLVSVAYFGPIAAGWISGQGRPAMHLFAHAVLALVVLQCGLTFWAARTTPKDGRALHDEREAAIIARSHTLGFYVLLVLVAGPYAVHLGHPPPILGNYFLADIVAAVLVVAVAQIVMFRRGF